MTFAVSNIVEVSVNKKVFVCVDVWTAGLAIIVGNDEINNRNDIL